MDGSGNSTAAGCGAIETPMAGAPYLRDATLFRGPVMSERPNASFSDQRAALKQLLEQRAAGPFVSLDEMKSRIASMIVEERRAGGEKA